MPKIPDCDLCRFCAHSPYMVCGVNPCGPDGNECPDFDAVVLRGELLEGGYYADDWIPQLSTQITDEQRLALLDWHPLFTGRCPNCEMPMLQTTPPRVHWDCYECGWMMILCRGCYERLASRFDYVSAVCGRCVGGASPKETRTGS